MTKELARSHIHTSRGGRFPVPHLRLPAIYHSNVNASGTFIGAFDALAIGYVADRKTGTVYNWIVNRHQT